MAVLDNIKGLIGIITSGNSEEIRKNIFNKDNLFGILRFCFRTDLLYALGIALILLILILPIPTWLLDIALSISITFSMLILMTVIFIERPIDFNVFPTVLLVSTLLRLSLNLASTRIILSNGHEGMGAAGEVIKAFGMFIMKGNFVIGIIVFAILIIVNFIVITTGSGRIAEVSARFTLDSMPGKQMAIDADLSAGLINEEQAKIRRKELETETNFFGSMDGAAKFVRGDAVAGLLITFINIIAGIIIGVVQQGLSFAVASETYIILTVGDGLVTQVPSLIVSTAAGMLVSKSGTEGSMNKVMLQQLGGYPASMGMTSLLMLCFSMLPGIPKVPFLVIAAVVGYVALSVSKYDSKMASKNQDEVEESRSEEDELTDSLKMENVKIELGLGLLSLMHTEAKISLTEKIKSLRREMASSMGFIIPQIRIKDNFQYDMNEFAIKIKDSEIVKGIVYPEKYMVVNTTHDVDLTGITAKDPYFNVDVIWVDETLKDEAEEMGYNLIDAPSVIITSLNQIMRSHIHEIFSYSDVTELLSTLSENHQKLIKEITPSQIPVTTIQRALQELLSEGIAIKDLETIVEGVAEVCYQTKSPVMISEYLRTKMKRQLTSMVTASDNIVHIIALHPSTEQHLVESLVGDLDNRQLGCSPSTLQNLVRMIAAKYNEAIDNFGNTVLVVSETLRRPIQSVISRSISELKVFSQNDLYPKVKMDIYAQITVES